MNEQSLMAFIGQVGFGLSPDDKSRSQAPPQKEYVESTLFSSPTKYSDRGFKRKDEWRKGFSGEFESRAFPLTLKRESTRGRFLNHGVAHS